jgi:hypothetical protein
MDPQTLINLGMGVLLTIVGWLSRQLWDAVERMKVDIKNIEITLPSHYARKDDIQSRFDKVEVMLEKIFDKLDLKQDKAKTWKTKPHIPLYLITRLHQKKNVQR